MSMFSFLASVFLSNVLATTGDNLIMRGELDGRWYVKAAGMLLYAASVSIILVLALELWRRRYVG